MDKKKKQKRKSTPEAQYDKNEEWVKTHIKQFGEDPSFFWNIWEHSLVYINMSEVILGAGGH